MADIYPGYGYPQARQGYRANPMYGG
ncbi:EF hand-like protein [Leishmania donovani]|uniref:EF hand-like protein n=1 Tax=Leishmania donovani TaxID=5661 RepID=E9BBM2_LEIDO|nr:EF hand-like protein [Leishmania donovani]CBZ32647.1 EF hand-like protein [Leishmania donovani]